MALTTSEQIRPGAVRTATPFLVGWLVSFLARHGLDINDDNAAYLIGAVGGYLYYVVARFLEVELGEKWRYVLGLGLAGSTPVYVAPADATTKGDLGRTLLGTLGVVLIVVGVVLLLLALLNVIAVNVALIVVAVVLGLVLVLVDGSSGGRGL